MTCFPFENKDCEKFCDNRKRIPVEENKKTYLAINTNEKIVSLSKVDGCLINKGLRNDYLLLDCTDKIAYFIELKGNNVPKYKRLGKELKHMNGNIGIWDLKFIEEI